MRCQLGRHGYSCAAGFWHLAASLVIAGAGELGYGRPDVCQQRRVAVRRDAAANVAVVRVPPRVIDKRESRWRL